MKRRRLSTEFRLVAAAAIWPSNAERNDEIARLVATTGFDWSLFLALAARHRVEGLVHRALNESGATPPAFVRETLAARAQRIAIQTLRQVAESSRIASAMAQANVRFTYVKGVTLAILAYKNLGVKQAWDIDLLIAPADVAAAVGALKALGYERTLPDPELSDARFEEWIRLCKESLWTEPMSGHVVELHTSLVDNACLMPGVGAQSRQQLVAVAPGITLPTLPESLLFTYLCVHGAAHAWSRLKWLADVAALLRTGDADRMERLYRDSLALGGGRSAGQALLLSADLLRLPLPAALRKEIESDRKTRWLAQLAIRAMTARGAQELDHTIFGTTPIHLSHFMIGRGLRYKWAELQRKWSNPEDRVLSPLPRQLRPLGPLLAVPRWIKRRYDMNRG